LEQPAIEARHEVLVGLIGIGFIIVRKVVFDCVVPDLAD